MAPTTSTLRPPLVVDRGRGHPVLFVQGQPGLGSDWDQVAARLTDHRLLIVDRPGYGRSGEETLSIEGNAENAKFTFTGVPKPDAVPDAPAVELASEPVVTKSGAVGGPPSGPGPSDGGGGGTASAVG